MAAPCLFLCLQIPRLNSPRPSKSKFPYKLSTRRSLVRHKSKFEERVRGANPCSLCKKRSSSGPAGAGFRADTETQGGWVGGGDPAQKQACCMIPALLNSLKKIRLTCFKINAPLPQKSPNPSAGRMTQALARGGSNSSWTLGASRVARSFYTGLG